MARIALGRVLVVGAALNLAAAAILGGYDFRIGPLHLFAHQALKPQQILVAALLLALALRPRLAQRPALPADGAWPVFLLAIPAVLFLPSIGINFEYRDWNHAHITSAIRGLRPLAALFTGPQADGFYRPLGFVSLWIDNLIFGPHAWGYHLQSVALHLLNVTLAWRLFRRLNFGARTASWAAATMAVAAVALEPVIWPAARFDLLAAAFTMAALACAIDYLRGGRGLACAAAFTFLGILSKETAYSVPVVVLFLIATAPVWDLQRPVFARTARLLAAVSVPCAMGLLIRLAVYAGLGGYPGQSLAPTLRGAVMLVVRLFPAPLLALNSNVRLGLVGGAAAVLFAACCVLIALGSGALDRKTYAIAGLALASALPVLNVAGWMGPSMLHSRYFYWPAVWVALLMVRLIETCRVPRVALAALLIANALAMTSNLLVYRDVLRSAERVAARVGRDVRERPEVRAIQLAGLPETDNGVVFFADEAAGRAREESQGRPVDLVPAAAADPPPSERTRIYRWDPLLGDVR
jgi:hypothetical protein